MNEPSFNLLAQSILSGIFIGSLYGLVGLGLGLTWGLLRQINLAHFGFVFLGGYLSYHMATVWGVDPLLTRVRHQSSKFIEFLVKLPIKSMT